TTRRYRRAENRTLGPISASQFGSNNLRIPSLSLTVPHQRDQGTDLHTLAAIDARLARLCEAWASLPERIILALIESAGGLEAVPLRPPSRGSLHLGPTWTEPRFGCSSDQDKRGSCDECVL